MSEKKKKMSAEPEETAAETVPEETAETAPEETTGEAAENAPDPLEVLEAQNKDLQDQLLRRMAEFDNFRKRTARERTELYDDATAKCVSQIVTVVDNFERALETPCGDEEFKKGVQMIFDQFMQVLSSMGVEEIDAVGKPFDPALHNAVSRTEDENYGENTVCQVFQKGFTLKGKVIRHAMVVVANS